LNKCGGCENNENLYILQSDRLSLYGYLKGDTICLRQVMGMYVINGEFAIRTAEIKEEL